MSPRSRRYFWGNSLAQAIMSAARHHGVDPGRLAYQVHRKRHGFVRLPRVVVIEVDPAAPARPASEASPAPTQERGARAERPARSAAGSPPGASAGRRSGEDRGRPPARDSRQAAPRRGAAEGGDIWDAPDEDAVLAAAEAARRLLRLARLELEVEVTILPDERLEVRLAGQDEAEIEQRGLELLEDLEHLVPRAAHGLSGRMVRCRVECAGMRAAHERRLQEFARAVAAEVLAEGAPREIEALAPGDRRVVHLALEDLPGVETESFGSGLRKKMVIRPAARRG